MKAWFYFWLHIKYTKWTQLLLDEQRSLVEDCNLIARIQLQFPCVPLCLCGSGGACSFCTKFGCKLSQIWPTSYQGWVCYDYYQNVNDASFSLCIANFWSSKINDVANTLYGCDSIYFFFFFNFYCLTYWVTWHCSFHHAYICPIFCYLMLWFIFGGKIGTKQNLLKVHMQKNGHSGRSACERFYLAMLIISIPFR